jgi:transcriptional regulator with XRE-family HTH domain
VFLKSQYPTLVVFDAEMEKDTDQSKTLNDLIKESNLTWKQLADRLGVSEAAIGHWANKNPEKRKVPALDKAVALAIELGVDIKTLAHAMEIPNWDKLG